MNHLKKLILEQIEELKVIDKKQIPNRDEVANKNIEFFYYTPKRQFPYRAYINEIVYGIEVLQTNRVLKHIGQGLFGTTFLLDNDHVIKFFDDGLDGAEKEIAMYKKYYDEQHSGASDRNAPSITK